MVNVIPADVRIENYIRGANVEAIIDATKKVTRSWHAGADAIGAAKALAWTVIDLLYDDATEAAKVIDEFVPKFTKEEYLEEWGKIGERFR